MSQGPPPRSTAQRNRDRASIRRMSAGCALCGEPIDYTLPYLHPGEFVVDHVVPLKHGGADALSNKQPAHRSCNRAKGAHTDGGPVLRRSGSLDRTARGRTPPGSPSEHVGSPGTELEFAL